MTVLEFLRTASEDELVEKMSYMSDQNKLSVAIDSNVLSPFALCEEDDCEYYYHDECHDECIMMIRGESCPRNDVKEVQKNEIRKWLNGNLEFEKN